MISDGIKFSGIQSDITGGGRAYNYRVMLLPWEGDHANVMEPLPNDKYMIGTELGFVILFSLPKNKALGVFEVGRWVSSLAYCDKLIWSVGADRTVCAYHIRSQKPVSRFVEATSPQLYPETGISLKNARDANFHIYNCGALRFKLFSSRTRKPLKCFDVAQSPLLRDTAFMQFSQAERVVRGYCVSRRSSQLLLIVNRYHPHLLVYDFRRMQVLRFCPVFKKIDRQAQMAINMRIFMTDQEENLFFVNQLKDKKTGKVETHATVLELRTASEPDGPGEYYHLLPTQLISSSRG
jgi:hypothetical protein